MKSCLACSLALFCTLIDLCAAADDPRADLEIALVDETLTPLRGFEVVAVFPQTGKAFATYQFVKQRGQTNADGVVRLAGRTLLNPTIGAQSPTHYASGRELKLNVGEGGSKDGKWLPSPFRERLLLKRIVKPVQMYAAANWTITLPGGEDSFGFDLEKLDWVRPHGAGIISDLVFKQDKVIDNVLGSSATLRISFSNPGDGLIPLYELRGAESELKLPRTAPTEGYTAERRLETNWTSSREHAPPARPALGYIYRVRTVLDESGQVRSAWYGKIDGEFEWDPCNFPTGQVTFTYYLNPDGTPNLEFDRKRNLFLDLAVEHTVRRP